MGGTQAANLAGGQAASITLLFSLFAGGPDMIVAERGLRRLKPNPKA